MVIKACLSFNDETYTKLKSYRLFDNSMSCVLLIFTKGFDRHTLCAVHFIAMERFGPTLKTFCNLLPGKVFDDRLLLALAIQLARAIPPRTRVARLTLPAATARQIQVAAQMARDPQRAAACPPHHLRAIDAAREEEALYDLPDRLRILAPAEGP